MSRKPRYCTAQYCENFKGTTDCEIHMFKFPTEKKQLQQWVDAVNKHNSEKQRVIGRGFLCQLHFTDSDLLVVKGVLKLKPGTVPVLFNMLYDVCAATEHASYINLEQLAENIVSEANENLRSEVNHVKKTLLQSKNDSDLICTVKKLQIEKLSNENRELKDELGFLKEMNKEYASKIKTLEEQLHRANNEAVGNTDQKDLIECLLYGRLPGQKYPEKVRKFSLNMNYYSPRAYEYLRHFFNNNLPEESTIRKWYANSDLHSEPGITLASLKFLKGKVDEMNKIGSELVVALCLDEIAIRQQVIWSPVKNRMLGYVTYGIKDPDNPQIAKEAIVFVVSGLNMKFRIPVAYQFVNSLDALGKAELLKSVMAHLFETGVKVASITFDGHATNKKMCEILGANLDIFSESFQPYILIDGKHKVFIFYDVCHMEKLIRGQFDKRGTLTDEDGGEIKWMYVELLVKYSQEKGLSMIHKLGKSHLDWRRHPMHCRTAIETLSRSAADGLEFLRSNGFEEFVGAAPTSRKMYLFNDLFDVFNTKSTFKNENVFKNAMNEVNRVAIKALFNEAIPYIKALSFGSETGQVKKICRSNKKTGYVGFVIDMHSLDLLYDEYVTEKKFLSYIPTYYLNQDAVEMFFGKIRAMGGFNENPNVIHFLGAYRKLLGNDSILASKHGNCEPQQMNTNPLSDILYVTSRRAKSIPNENEDEIIVSEEAEEFFDRLDDLDALAIGGLTDDVRNHTIAYIANIIEGKIQSTDRCTECVNVFMKCKKVEKLFLSSKFSQPPCESTYQICRKANQFLKIQFLKGNIHFQTIHYSILNNIDTEKMFSECDFSRHPTHKLYLIRAIVDGFIQIKGTYMAKIATEDIHTQKFRHKFRHLIHFYGQ